MKGLQIADYAVVAAFFAAMVGVGLWYSRRHVDAKGFCGGDKSVPWWLAGVSFYMGSFSALAFVMYSALAWKYGWVSVTISWLGMPAVLLITWLLAVRWRRAATTSPLEFIERRFSNRMRQGLVWLGLPMRLLDGAFKLLAIGTVVGVGLDFPLETAIAISGVVIVFYTFLGGLKATLAADFIQFFVLMAAVVVLPFFCLPRVGGLSGFVERAPEGFFSLVSGRYSWAYITVFFYSLVTDQATSWSMVQRFYATRSERDAKRVGYLVAVLLFVGPPLFFFPAMSARIFLPDLGEAEMNGVYALVCKMVLPSGLVGLVVAAMFSATMSTLAGFYNAMSSVVTNDVYVRMFRPDASARRKLLVARLSTVVLGAIVIALTFLMRAAQGADDLFNVTNKMFGVFGPPIALPMLAGLLVRRVTRRAGLVGLAAGIGTGALAFVVGGWHPIVREMIPMNVITSTATVLGLVWGSVRLRDSESERTDVARFFRSLESEGEP